MENLNLPKVTIKNNEGSTSVFIDGKEIRGVRSVEFLHNREKSPLPVLQISLLADQITIDTPILFDLPEAYWPYYVSADKLISAGVLTQDRLNELIEQGAL